MSRRKIIDLSPRTSQTLDLTHFFITPTVSAPYDRRYHFSDVMTGLREQINVYTPQELQVDRFETLDALDLANPELFVHAPVAWWKFWKKETSREKVVDLVPKLNIPFGGLDIRRIEGRTILSSGENQEHEKVLFSFTRPHAYPDLFVRSLPWERKILRFFRVRKRLWKGVAYTLGIVLLS